MYSLELKQGTAESIAKQALRAGIEIPARIAKSPELITGLELYLDAFFDLDRERSHGTGLSCIPWTSIKQYCEAYELDEEQTEDMFYFIKAMDKAHLDRLESKQSKK